MYRVNGVAGSEYLEEITEVNKANYVFSVGLRNWQGLIIRSSRVSSTQVRRTRLATTPPYPMLLDGSISLSIQLYETETTYSHSKNIESDMLVTGSLFVVATYRTV